MGIPGSAFTELPILRKFNRFYYIPFLKEEGLFNHMFKFTDISKPLIFHKGLQNFLRDTLNLYSIFFPILLNKMIYKKWNIVNPFPQRWNLYLEDIKTIE